LLARRLGCNKPQNKKKKIGTRALLIMIGPGKFSRKKKGKESQKGH